MAAGQMRDSVCSHPSFGSPSNNSSPDDEEQQHYGNESMSPSHSEMEEEKGVGKVKVEVDGDGEEHRERAKCHHRFDKMGEWFGFGIETYIR